MYIDLNSIDSAPTLQKYMNLPNKINNFDISSFLTTVWESAAQVWEDVDLRDFTNHDLKHSIRILGFFEKLDTIYNWSNYEKVIFIAAALVLTHK